MLWPSNWWSKHLAAPGILDALAIALVVKAFPRPGIPDALAIELVAKASS
jgi:hypothetical protein